MGTFYSAWDDLVKRADEFIQSPLFKYDLVDFSKEALRYMFDDKYTKLRFAWLQSDLYKFRYFYRAQLKFSKFFNIVLKRNIGRNDRPIRGHGRIASKRRALPIINMA
jgi:hypothetical protein